MPYDYMSEKDELDYLWIEMDKLKIQQQPKEINILWQHIKELEERVLKLENDKGQVL